MNLLPAIGAALLIAALGLMWGRRKWTDRLALAVLAAVGLLDLYLIAAGPRTITNWVHSLAGPWLDAGVMVAILGHTWAVWGRDRFLPVLMGIIIGHLFWSV